MKYKLIQPLMNRLMEHLKGRLMKWNQEDAIDEQADKAKQCERVWHYHRQAITPRTHKYVRFVPHDLTVT